MTLCPICGANAERSLGLFDRNRRVSDEVFTYRDCGQCGTLFLPDAPADLSRYYQSEYYAIPSVTRLEAIASRNRSKIELINKFARGPRLLEVGPAFGVFAWQAKQDGYVVEAIERDERCSAFLNDALKIRTVNSTDPVASLHEMEPHDVIALWHVLEHLPDIPGFVRAAAANLAPGGILTVALPNVQATQHAIMGAHWPHLDAPRHLALLPAGTLIDFAAKLGLQLRYVTTDDADARHWNRFGWQWLLMNRFRAKFMKRTMLVLGYGLSIAMSIFDRRPMRGSAYTLVLEKVEA